MPTDRIEVSCSCGASGVIEGTYGPWVKARYREFLAAHAVCREWPPAKWPQPITPDPGKTQT